MLRGAEIGKGEILDFFVYKMSEVGKTGLTEVEIQKAIYILQATGVVPSVYTYNGYFRGPISNDLKDDIRNCSSLEEKGYGYYMINRMKLKEITGIPDLEKKEKRRFEKLLKQVIINSSEEELSYLSKLVEISKSPLNSRLFLR